MRYFIIGSTLGIVISCMLAFVFFLRVEDNPKVLLRLDLWRELAPLLIIAVLLVVYALYARRGWWKIPAGFGLATLLILALTANWALTGPVAAAIRTRVNAFEFELLNDIALFCTD